MQLERKKIQVIIRKGKAAGCVKDPMYVVYVFYL